MPTSVEPHLVWFRRDLRLDANPAWSGHDGPTVALFVLDARPWRIAGPRRQSLLAAHLRSLDETLRRNGGGLVVFEGDPVDLVPRAAVALGARCVSWNADVSGYSQRRDAAVAAALGSDGIEVATHWGTLVHPPGAIRAKSTGTVPRVFTPFHKQWATTEWDDWTLDGDVSVLDPAALSGLAHLPVVPVPEASDGTVGGEDAAHARLRSWLDEVDGYPDRRDRPDEAEGTSHISADLRFGTLSPRTVATVVGESTAGRRAFVRQLAWRDWYAHLFVERPELASHAMAPGLDGIEWLDDPDGLEAWRTGRTGYPIVDAGMRELAATGWMHNRVRMITASFLVKDLLIDWRLGEAHFRRELVDFEVSQNVGNWQWVAGTGPDAAPYFRIFNPIMQGRKFDPDGAYVRRWVPELRELGDRDIHTPWEVAPLDLAVAGITLGETYPWPIVDHAMARDRTLAAYAAAKGTA